nr:peptidoglycan DD-metalloendopeptidase family protein [Campylobacter sp.]
MRFLFIFLCFGIVFGANVQDKIKNQQNTIKSNQRLEVKINKKLDDLANDIIKGEKNIQKTNSQIEDLRVQVKKLESRASSANVELNKLTKQNNELIKNQKQMEMRLIKIISEDFAYDLIAPKDFKESQESIIADEILSRLSTSIRDEFARLAKNYTMTSDLIEIQSKKINSIKSDLRDFKTKQARLSSLQTKQQNSLSNLKKDKDNYTAQLRKIQAQQIELRKTLEDLQIVAKNARAKKQQESVKELQTDYKMSVKRYNGPKTIAPLDEFSIKQKFGDYIDPIYKIKIFNQSVVLRSNEPNARVKSVLPGKVVFAKDTAVLEKVVIVENENGIHTIYAHLSKIAPTIKVGSQIKKGYIIGRVEQDLTFEVTQRNYHINPMDLIASK